MSVHEELHEHAQHASHPFDKKVAATMAVIAAFLAVTSVLGHLATTEELLLQSKAVDQWSYYQAKSIRRYESEIARDLMEAMKGTKTKYYEDNLTKYKKDGDNIQEKATDLEKESEWRGRQAVRLHLGEIFLEMAIVFASLAILIKRSFMWYLSVAGLAAGILTSLTTLTIQP